MKAWDNFFRLFLPTTDPFDRWLNDTNGALSHGARYATKMMLTEAQLRQKFLQYQQSAMETKKLKPFDLARAKAGDKVVTRDGREFKFGAHNPNAVQGSRVVGWLEHHALTCYENGSYYATTYPDKNDLFMAPKVMEYFAVVFKDSCLGVSISGTFPSSLDAMAFAACKGLDSFIKVIKVHEIEE